MDENQIKSLNEATTELDGLENQLKEISRQITDARKEQAARSLDAGPSEKELALTNEYFSLEQVFQAKLKT